MINYKPGIWMKPCDNCGKIFKKTGKKDKICPACWDIKRMKTKLIVAQKRREHEEGIQGI